jgi:hypothetical protein
MQLNLLMRLGQRVVLSRAEPPSTLPGAWRDSAISQLEALARANERALARARRRRQLWTAGVSALLLLWAAALWRQASEGPRVPVPMLAVAQPRAEPVAVAAVAPAEVPAQPTSGLIAAAAADAPPAAGASVVTDAVPVVASDDEAARKARTQWLARRKAAQQAQERARAEDEAQQRQRLALAAQLDAARALQPQRAEAAERERAAAADRERRQALLLAQNTRRGVAELCGSAGGWAAEQQCQARQCYKAEHQGDAVCQRLRDLDLARLQRGADH